MNPIEKQREEIRRLRSESDAADRLKHDAENALKITFGRADFEAAEDGRASWRSHGESGFVGIRDMHAFADWINRWYPREGKA